MLFQIDDIILLLPKSVPCSSCRCVIKTRPEGFEHAATAQSTGGFCWWGTDVRPGCNNGTLSEKTNRAWSGRRQQHGGGPGVEAAAYIGNQTT